MIPRPNPGESTVGTVYCLHHDEEELVGSEPVPCPLCGFGAEQEPALVEDELEAANVGDSNDALHHALFRSASAGPPDATETDPLRGYW